MKQKQTEKIVCPLMESYTSKAPKAVLTSVKAAFAVYEGNSTIAAEKRAYGRSVRHQRGGKPHKSFFLYRFAPRRARPEPPTGTDRA